MSVITAVELEDLVLARESTRQPYCAHGGFSSRIDEPHFLNRGEGVAYCFSKDDFIFCWGPEARPPANLLAERVLHGLSCVPEDERAPGTHKINVGNPIFVHYAAAPAGPDEDRIAADAAECPHGAVDTPRNRSLSTNEQGLGTLAHRYPQRDKVSCLFKKAALRPPWRST